MKTAWVLGASGQIGRPLTARLLAAGWQVFAVSRAAQRQPRQAGLCWLAGSLEAMPAFPAEAHALFSCGPLGAFSQWYAAARPVAGRVVAFSSTSAATKAASGEAAERTLAQSLRQAEQQLAAACAGQGAALTLLRPTLIYGYGMDKSLSRIVALARRFGRFVLPRDATGLRQPVHADDLAAAALACLAAPASHGQCYDLPGGETLPYDEMVRRVLATATPPLPLYRLPAGLFAGLLTLAQAAGLVNGFNAAMRVRLRENLCFDAAPAARDLGYRPRPFRPEAGMFTAG